MRSKGIFQSSQAHLFTVLPSEWKSWQLLLVLIFFFTEGEQISHKPASSKTPYWWNNSLSLQNDCHLVHFCVESSFHKDNLNRNWKSSVPGENKSLLHHVSVLIFWCSESFSALSVLNANLSAGWTRKHTGRTKFCFHCKNLSGS